MGKVNILINNKPYTLVCDNGEEERTINAAKVFNKKLVQLKLSYPNIPSDLLMIITIIQIQDKLNETETLLEKSMKLDYKEGEDLFKKITEQILRIQQLTEKL